MRELYYKSTRGQESGRTASEAILKGIADDGGLFVPQEIPTFDLTLRQLSRVPYQQVAYEVMKLFLTDFTEEELCSCIDRAYDGKFKDRRIVPVKRADGAYYMELYHGATIAFKDMALSLLPHLLTTAAKKNHVKNDIVILTATSGDTGKAALAGFANVPHTKIIVFYPKDGVSAFQERQMVTQAGDNTLVAGIRGNFDEAQTGVKQMFSDRALKETLDRMGYQFSSANSINIGRLVPQIVYYVYAYSRLLADGTLKDGEEINIVVPTGNFGNILAAYYAKCCGLPVHRLICASNENKVLYDFFRTGIYDKNRPFILTSSPSMDILISSNLERLIYRITGDDAQETAFFMQQLSQTGRYEITDEQRRRLGIFYGNFCSEEETSQAIRSMYKREGYLIDTHTAVARGVYQKYLMETKDTETKTLIASTASPFKFAKSVLSAIGGSTGQKDDFALIDELSLIGHSPVPLAVQEVKAAPIRHDHVIDIEEMPQTVLDFLRK